MSIGTMNSNHFVLLPVYRSLKYTVMKARAGLSKVDLALQVFTCRDCKPTEQFSIKVYAGVPKV